MKPLTIADSPAIILGLQDEIRRSEESRYDHRLHGVLLVAQGVTCPEVARLLGDAPRSVEYWVRRFEKGGLGSLLEGERPGRPRRLSDQQMKAVAQVLRRSPTEAGLSGNLWEGKTLSRWIEQKVRHPRWRTAVPAPVPSTRLPLAQAAACTGSCRSRTAESA